MIYAYFQILLYLLQYTETKKKILAKLIEIRTGYLQKMTGNLHLHRLHL
jgi:hypothetical protein